MALNGEDTQELEEKKCATPTIAIVDGQYTVLDNGLNPRHSAYYMPAEEDWAVHDIVKEHYEIHFRQ